MHKQTQNMCKMFFSFFFVLFEWFKHIYFKQLKKNTVEQLDFTSILSFNCFYCYIRLIYPQHTCAKLVLK